jgi:hypothetical protein
MEVEVSDWARERIEKMVASGRVSCEREAIDFAFTAVDVDDRAVDEFFEGRSDEWWADLRALVQEGIDAADAGDLHPLTDELIEDIERRGLQRLRERNARST